MSVEDFRSFDGRVVYSDGTDVYDFEVSDAEFDLTHLSAITPDDGAIYMISNKVTGESLTAENFATSNNSYVGLRAYEKDLSQLWRTVKNMDGTYRLENMASRMSLTLKNADIGKKEMSLSVCLDGKNDMAKSWRIYSKDGTLDNCIIKNEYSSLVATANDGGYVRQSGYGEGDSQLWCLQKQSDGDGEYPYLLALAGDYRGNSSCPEIIYHNGMYYNYSQSGKIAVKTSPDLINWTLHRDMYALSEYPLWFKSVSGKDSIWAPGAYKIGDKYYLYYATSSLGSQDSGIGVAVSEDPSANDWRDLGLVIRSYKGGDYNCIDPNIFIDTDGSVYLVFGSYWTGIYMRKIDPQTGLLDKNDSTLHHIAQGIHDMEAPYLIKHGDHYYLFVARGGLRKGTYYWAVGRSESLFGPYIDRDGTTLLSGDGGTRLTEWKNGVCGVGHAQYFEDKDGNSYMVAESWPYRTSSEHGTIQLHISKIVWTEDGWPVTVLDPNVLEALG